MARSEVGAALVDGTESRPGVCTEEKINGVLCIVFFLGGGINVGPVTVSCEHGDGTWVSVQCAELVEGLKL